MRSNFSECPIWFQTLQTRAGHPNRRQTGGATRRVNNATESEIVESQQGEPTVFICCPVRRDWVNES